MVTDTAPNVLSARYASKAMNDIWSPESKVRFERELWIAVLEGQIEMGLDVPPGTVEAYRAVVDRVDLESIAARERVTRHDVKARIEEFCVLAGTEHIHKGMTSRDLTENVEQLQIRRSLELVLARAAAALVRLAEMAVQHERTVITGRSHNVPAQATTLGKRFANAGEELLWAFEFLEHFTERYPLRGLKGPVGTQQDLLDLFAGDQAKVDRLERRIADLLGFGRTMGSVGQVYPRSLDFAAVSMLLALASGPANLSKTIRLMAGADLVSEGFKQGQVGSSAMPHKMNSRSSERITGFVTILSGLVSMGSGLVGDQWNEGDVSDSVVRRVMLPDAFFTIDGLLETFLTVLSEFQVYPAVIEAELERYFPFLATTRLLMAAIQAGAGRETAHERIRLHATEAARSLRTEPQSHNRLFDLVAGDEELPIPEPVLRSIAEDRTVFTGSAAAQVHAFSRKVAKVAERFPEAADYRPNEIL
jgi:adenylosuccinate lyase